MSSTKPSVLGGRHGSIPSVISNAVLIEFQLLHVRNRFNVPVREDQPFITIEDVMFLPGRVFPLTLTVSVEIMKRAGMSTEDVENEGQSLVFRNEVPEGRFDDVFNSVVVPATMRWTPPTDGTVRRCVVVWYSYYTNKRSGETFRRGKALPLDGSALSEDEYIPPPAPNQPISANILFYPAIRRGRVYAVASARDGRPIVLDEGFPMRDEQWGQERLVMLLERGNEIAAIPVPQTPEEEVQVEQALVTALAVVPSVELTDEEVLIEGEKANIFHVLAPYSITPDSDLEAVGKARRKMAGQYHPDKGAWRKPFGEVIPPAFMVKANNEAFARFSTALDRLEVVLGQRAGQDAGTATAS